MRSADDTRVSEAGFGVIEMIVAAILLAIVLGGVAVASSGTSKSMARSTVRDTQSSVLSSAAEKLRSDSSWTSETPLTCSDITANPKIDVTSWIRARMARELTTDELRGTQFEVVATATAIDSPADGLCGVRDADGVVPDYYDVELAVHPDASTAERFPKLAAMTQNFDVDFSSRVSGGRLLVQACYVAPQVDERIPTGSCDEISTIAMPILPPSQIRSDAGPTANCTSAIDCEAWKCANPLLDSACDAGEFGDQEFVTIHPAPGAGWSVTLAGDDANTSTEPSQSGVLNANGTIEFNGLLPGRYKVTLTGVAASNGAALVPWTTHSVPASSIATVERGVTSRVVQMYRPAARSHTLDIPVRTLETGPPPWLQTIYPHFEGSKRQLSLVPAPVGRTQAPPAAEVKRGDTVVSFSVIEPGLYTNQVTQKDISTILVMQDSVGFVFVPPGDSNPMVLPDQDIYLLTKNCTKSIRQHYIDTYGLGTTLTHTTIVDGKPKKQTWKVAKCGGGGGGDDDDDGGGGGGTT